MARKIIFRGNKGIIFRGKNESGEWLYGSLIDCKMFNSIIDLDKISGTPIDLLGSEIVRGKVQDETIGQFTGLKDKNGKEIYEGDIVSKELPFSNDGYKYRCEYDEEVGAFKFYSLQSSFDGYLYWNDLGVVEVIGNIHDNPELLEDCWIKVSPFNNENYRYNKKVLD